MAYKLQLKRGALGSLPTGIAGEPLFTTDTNDLYIGTGASNQKFQKFIASGTSSQFLKGDGSLDSNTYYLASNPSAFIALSALSATAPLSYNNTTGVFTIAQATGSVNGYLSSTDWTTFNNKQATLSLTTTGTSGAATLVGSTLNIPQYADQFVGTVTSVAALTIGTTGTDLSSSVANGTTTPVITLNVPTASATNRGALSSADWTTFNAKYNLPSLTSGSVLFSNGTTIAQDNANFFWDDANNRLGIGTATPSASVHIVSTTVNNALLLITPNNNSSQYPFFLGGATLTSENYLRANSSNIEFFRNGGASTIRTVGSNNNLVLQSSTDILLNTNGANERVRIFTSTGNVGINTGSTDGGQRLQVYGDAFIKGSGATSATIGLTVQNSAGNNILRIANNGAISLGNSSNRPSFFTFTTNQGSIDFSGTNLSFYNSTSNLSATYGAFAFGGDSFFQTSGNQLFFNINMSFIPTSGTATFSNLVSQPVINQTGGANGITRGLYVSPTLTAAADWRSIEWSNNTGFGLYGAGTANNYLGGALGIGITSSFTVFNFRIAKALTGNSLFWNAMSGGTVQSDVTNQAVYFRTGASTVNSTFTLSNLYHYLSVQDTIGVSSTVTNQYGYAVDGSLIGATNNFGFHGSIPNGTNRWNLYMAGTADNYLRGKLLINTTTVGTFDLDVNGTARVSDSASTILTLNSTNGTGYSAIKIDSLGVEKALIGFGTYLTSDAGAAIRTASGVPFTIAIGGGVPTLTIATSGAATFSSSVTATSFVKSGGTSAQYLMADGSTSTLTNPVTGTGTTNYIPKWTSASAIGNSLVFDNGTNVGIGTSSPSAKLHVVGASVLFQNAGTFELDLLNTTSGNYLRATAGATDSNIGTIQNIPFSFIMNSSRVGQFTSTNGNLILQNGGTFTDAGYKLDVNGTGRFQFALTVANTALGNNGGLILNYAGNANSRTWRLANDIDSYGDFKIQQSTTQTGSTYVNILSLSPSGAATFSSSVTATSFIPSSATVPTNGMYLSAANTLDFATNSVNRLSIASNGDASFSANVYAVGFIGGLETSSNIRFNQTLSTSSSGSSGSYLTINVNGTLYKLDLLTT